LESGKPGAAEYHANDKTFAAVCSRLPEIGKQYPDIRRRVEKAATRPSLGANLRRNTLSSEVLSPITHG
jgi:hypothetical protein